MMSLVQEEDDSSVSSVWTYDPKARDDGKLTELTTGSDVSSILQLMSKIRPTYRIIRHKPELCGYPGYERMERLKAENQVTTLTLHNEELLRELNAARSRIEALMQEMKTMRGCTSAEAFV